MSQNDVVDIKGVRGAAELGDKNLGDYSKALQMYSKKTAEPKKSPARKGKKKGCLKAKNLCST